MHFRSSHISGFLVAGLVATALASAWVLSSVRDLQWRSVQEQEVELVMRAIEGGALKFAQLNSSNLATEFLGSHFSALSPGVGSSPRFLGARIEGGRSGAEIYAEWHAHKPISLDVTCEKTFLRKMTPAGALYDFNVTVVTNSCWESPAISRLKSAAFIAPLVVSLGLLGALGTALIAMMTSVRRATEILRRTPDSLEVVTLANQVPWLEVRTMLKRALETSGANLQYFQAIIEEAEHDVNREFTRHNQALVVVSPHAVISSIMQKLVLDSRIAMRDEFPELRTPAEFSFSKIIELLNEQGFEVICKEFHGGQTISVADPDALTRLIINFGSNVRQHSANGRALCNVNVLKDCIQIVLENRVTFSKAIKLNLASLTGRIDVTSPHISLIRTYWGREGVGSRVIKRSAHTLGAKINVSIQKRTFRIVASLPVRVNENVTKHKTHRRAIGLISASLSAIAKNSVFSNIIFSADEILEKMKSNDVDEVMVDFPITNVPDTIVVRNVKDANRVTGILKLWRGEIT